MATERHGNGLWTEYLYDLLDRPTSIVYRTAASNLLYSLAYTFDVAGMITQKVIKTTGFTNSIGYGYDSLYRLTSESSGGTTKSYGYDLAGNRTNITVGGASTNYAYGIGNRLSGWTGGGQYQHNTAGCVANITRSGGRTLRLEWDSQYRVKAVYTNNVLAERYGYDALGRRAWFGTATTTNRLVYDGLDLVAMTDSAGNLQRTWLHGPGIDDVLSMTVYGAQTNTYTYIKDHQNTVLALVNDAGVVIERYDYDAWGNARIFDGSGTPLTSSAIGNPFTFQGREISWATGLINFRARWYDPDTGRWLSNDPIGISGGLNQYVFCSDNPVNFTDAFGLTAVEEVVKGAYIYVKYPGDKMHGPHVHVFARRGRTLLGRVTPDGARVLTGRVPNTALKKLAGGAIFGAVMIALEPTALADDTPP